MLKSLHIHAAQLIPLVAIMFTSLACTVQLEPELQLDDEVARSATGTTRVLITGTLQIREGGVLEDRERVAISQQEDDVVSRQIGLDHAGYVPWMRNYVRQGNLMFQVRQNAEGVADSISGDEINADVPALIESSLGVVELAGDQRLHELIDYLGHPVADMLVIDQMVAEGVITETAATSHLGLAIREFEVNLVDPAYAPTVFARVWLSTPDGYKVKVERWLDETGGEPDVVFLGQNIDTSVDAGDDYFVSSYTDPDQFGRITTDFVRINVFDPISGTLPSVPEATSLIYPRSLPVSNTFTLDSSVFITGTFDSRLMEGYVRPWDGSSGDRYWWVTQEFTDTGLAAFVIQGPDMQLDPPVDLAELWPPSWEGVDPTILLEHLYETGATGSFADSTPYSLYGFSDPSLAPYRVWVPPYDFLLTWQEPGGVRLVVLTQGLTETGAIAFSESYRAAAHE